MFKCRAAPYLRDIVVNLFRGLAAVVTLNLQSVVYQWLQLLLQFEMFAKDSSMLEVDPRVSPRDAYRRQNFLDHGLFLHKPQDVRAVPDIRVGKRQDLSCVEKAVFFSHEYNFVINLYLYISPVEIRHLDKDQSACATCLTGSLRMVYFGFILVLAVQVSSVQFFCQHFSHIVVNVAL